MYYPWCKVHVGIRSNCPTSSSPNLTRPHHGQHIDDDDEAAFIATTARPRRRFPPTRADVGARVPNSHYRPLLLLLFPPPRRRRGKRSPGLLLLLLLLPGLVILLPRDDDDDWLAAGGGDPGQEASRDRRHRGDGDRRRGIVFRGIRHRRRRPRLPPGDAAGEGGTRAVRERGLPRGRDAVPVLPRWRGGGRQRRSCDRDEDDERLPPRDVPGHRVRRVGRRRRKPDGPRGARVLLRPPRAPLPRRLRGSPRLGPPLQDGGGHRPASQRRGVPRHRHEHRGERDVGGRRGWWKTERER